MEQKWDRNLSDDKVSAEKKKSRTFQQVWENVNAKWMYKLVVNGYSNLLTVS